MWISQYHPDRLSRQDVDEILFNGVEDNQESGDCMLVFGSQKCLKYRVPKAIGLYKDKRASKILFSGGNLWAGQTDAEAILMKQMAIKHGVSAADILIETKSKHTKENVLYSSDVLDKAIGLDQIKTMLLVTTTYHMRRCFLTCKTYLPGHIQYVLCPVDDQNTRRDNWFANDKGKARALGESKKLIQYVRNKQLIDLDVSFG